MASDQIKKISSNKINRLLFSLLFQPVGQIVEEVRYEETSLKTFNRSFLNSTVLFSNLYNILCYYYFPVYLQYVYLIFPKNSTKPSLLVTIFLPFFFRLKFHFKWHTMFEFKKTQDGKKYTKNCTTFYLSC